MTDERELQELDRRKQAVNDEGANRYGKETFQDYLTAIDKFVGGATPFETQRAIFNRPDAAEALAYAGQEVVGQLASNGDREIEKKFARIRNEQRKAHAIARGRRWID